MIISGYDYTVGSNQKIFSGQVIMKKSVQETLDHALPQYSRDDSYSPGIMDFQQMVLAHYDQYGRDMPWRNTTDPYQILVSEIMLQQTQVERVKTKFPEFIRAFPDFSISCSSSLYHLYLLSGRVWATTGGRSLYRNVLSGLWTNITAFFRQMSSTLATFPGIGRATASSIAAFAFNHTRRLH